MREHNLTMKDGNLLIEIKDFIKKLSYGRLLGDSKLDKDVAVEIELNKIYNYLTQGHIFLLFENNNILGLIGYKNSEWDSDHFGFPVCKLDYFLINEDFKDNISVTKKLYSNFDQWRTKNNIKVCFAQIDSSNFIPCEILQKNNFMFYECITQRSKNLNDFDPEIFDQINYRFASKKDSEILENIAKSNTFSKSHFYLDNNFDRNKVDSLYSKWIRKAINNKENKIIIIEENTDIAGFFIYRFFNLMGVKLKFAQLEFVAINKEFRGIGLGKKIFEAVISECYNNNIEIIDSTLVDKNIISQKIHEKYGFNLVNTYYKFHKWF